MTQEELKELLDKLRALADETEWVEFKKAQSSYDFNKLGKYFSALCNEANLKNQNNGWLIFGVESKTREIVGTNFRAIRADLDNLKLEIANKTTNRITFSEIYELFLPEGRIIMFQIPAAPKGIPIAWEGHYYGRDGESLVALNLQEIEQIRSQGQQFD
ncbi:MAG: ATP-binding protein [Nitrospirota bacterium]